MKTEHNLECKKCNLYNIKNGIIEKGNIYCMDCYHILEKKRANQRYYRKYKTIKVPIKFKRKDGRTVTFIGVKAELRKKKELSQ